MTSGRRIVAVAALFAVLAGARLLDTIARPPEESDTEVAVAALMPTAAPARSLASTWFCAGGTGVAGGEADHVIVIANPGAQPVNAKITAVGTEGEPATHPLEVPARSRVSQRVGDIVAAPYVAATVDIDAGGVAVEHVVSGPLGFSAAPCASSGSERWHLADGSTARDDTMLLALYNPFPEDAIIDLAFSTDQGRAVPSDFQGIVVKGGRVGIVNVGDHVRRRDRVSATIATRRGRVVADRIQLRNGAVKGLSVALAAPSPGDQWWFPDGYVGDGVTERFSIYNPTEDEALVSLELTLEEGGAEPFDLTLPPRSRLDVNATDEERIPKGTGHSVVVRSLNGVGVVVERSITAAPPASRAGTTEAVGARVLASRWLFAAGDATDTFDEWITIVNPGESPVQVSVTALAAGQPLAIEGLQDVSIPAGRRHAIRITDHIKREALALLVESTGGRIVAERALYRVGGNGAALAAGVPMR